MHKIQKWGRSNIGLGLVLRLFTQGVHRSSVEAPMPRSQYVPPPLTDKQMEGLKSQQSQNKLCRKNKFIRLELPPCIFDTIGYVCDLEGQLSWHPANQRPACGGLCLSCAQGRGRSLPVVHGGHFAGGLIFRHADCPRVIHGLWPAHLHTCTYV